MSERILLKLGGSIITDKARDGVANLAAMDSIAWVVSLRPELTLLIVHGAGSFGHPEAHRYGLAQGADRSNREGIALTHNAVCTLNQMMVRALRDRGVEALGIHPLAGAFARAGRLESMEIRPLQSLMEMGTVPVLHGDVVMDGLQGACIISGDQIVRYLGENLPFDRIGLATDVPGILSRNGEVMECITEESIGEIIPGGSMHTDVTGGMAGKVHELLGLAAAGIPSAVFHVSRLGDFLDGESHGGTCITGGGAGG